MGLFDFFKKQKKSVTIVGYEVEEKKEVQRIVEEKEKEEQEKEAIPFHEQEYRRALQLYDKAQRDKEYQKKITQYFELTTQIQEDYSIINNIGSFSTEAGDNLIEKCSKAIALETDIREKREYYENHIFDMSPPCKTLAMVFEKRGEYQRAATICVYAIESGYTNDGTKGGMRGRLARMIKKGNLPLTDNLKIILNL